MVFNGNQGWDPMLNAKCRAQFTNPNKSVEFICGPSTEPMWKGSNHSTYEIVSKKYRDFAKIYNQLKKKGYDTSKFADEFKQYEPYIKEELLEYVQALEEASKRPAVEWTLPTTNNYSADMMPSRIQSLIAKASGKSRKKRRRYYTNEPTYMNYRDDLSPIKEGGSRRRRTRRR